MDPKTIDLRMAAFERRIAPGGLSEDDKREIAEAVEAYEKRRKELDECLRIRPETLQLVINL